MRKFVGGIVASLFAASAFGAEYFNLDVTQAAHFELGTPAQNAGTRGVTGIYSNTTNFLGSAFANGGATLQGTNTITRMVTDDLGLINSSNAEITQVTFAVANLNTASVSCRPRIRFWFDNAGVPGAYLTDADNGASSIGFTFNPITLAPGVTLLTGNVSTSAWTLAPGTIHAGITYDNNNGGTGATAAQLDNMGVGLFDPPTEGTSTDNIFQTTAAGSFFGTANPAGAQVNFAGNPVANVGWEFVPEPSSLALLAVGALAFARRR